jgi:hypothetical protein
MKFNLICLKNYILGNESMDNLIGFYDKNLINILNQKVFEYLLIFKYLENISKIKDKILFFERIEYDAEEIFSSVQYFTGNGSALTYTLSPPVLDGTRIKVYVNNIEKIYNKDWTYSSPTLTFLISPFNNAQIGVGLLDKEYKNNTSDLYQQYIFEDGEATYFIDDNGYFVKRENLVKSLTSIASDDFSTFEATQTVNSTSWRS